MFKTDSIKIKQFIFVEGDELLLGNDDWDSINHIWLWLRLLLILWYILMRENNNWLLDINGLLLLLGYNFLD